ncbi:MAG: helix-hairpin-helix domain-containing protein [Anaerovoracaceae bacterium]|nr:helix-hairpin-helix domain-containing protein [Anaerovoracaceae bacterium]
MGRYRVALRRLDRVLLVAVFLLGALLLALPQHTEPYTETPFAESMAEPPKDLNAFLKMASTDLNTADRQALIDLPGIGETLADRLLEYRAQNGPFTDWEELTRVQGIGVHTVEDLRTVAYLGP